MKYYINKNNYYVELSLNKGHKRTLLGRDGKFFECRLDISDDIGDAIGLSREHWNRIVNGHSPCPKKHLEKLAKILGDEIGLRWQYLCAVDDDRHYEPRLHDDLVAYEKEIADASDVRFLEFMSDIGYTISYDDKNCFIVKDGNISVMPKKHYEAFKNAITDGVLFAANTFLSSPYHKVNKIDA